jgi:TonB-dependent SusC/RagA subfamily outer membrane receptor
MPNFTKSFIYTAFIFTLLVLLSFDNTKGSTVSDNALSRASLLRSVIQDTLPESGRIDSLLRIKNPNNEKIIQLGYGIETTESGVTSAIGRVSGKVLSQNGLVLNSEQALYGRIPGLSVMYAGGDHAITDANLLIRGQGTFTNSAPLILMDGFQRPLQSVNEIAGLSISEIESITILKDAAALAKYGQRGANGVVLVKTKRGQIGDLQISGSYEQAVTEPQGLPTLVGSANYARAINEARSNDGETPRYTDKDIQAYKNGNSPYFYPNVDWFDEVLRDAGMRSNLNLTAEGGGGRARYFAMANFISDNGIFSKVNQNEEYSTQNKYRRLNFRSNLDVNITDKILFQADVGGAIVERNIPGAGGGAGGIFNSI